MTLFTSLENIHEAKSILKKMQDELNEVFTRKDGNKFMLKINRQIAIWHIELGLAYLTGGSPFDKEVKAKAQKVYDPLVILKGSDENPILLCQLYHIIATQCYNLNSFDTLKAKSEKRRKYMWSQPHELFNIPPNLMRSGLKHGNIKHAFPIEFEKLPFTSQYKAAWNKHPVSTPDQAFLPPPLPLECFEGSNPSFKKYDSWNDPILKEQFPNFNIGIVIENKKNIVGTMSWRVWGGQKIAGIDFKARIKVRDDVYEFGFECRPQFPQITHMEVIQYNYDKANRPIYLIVKYPLATAAFLERGNYESGKSVLTDHAEAMTEWGAPPEFIIDCQADKIFRLEQKIDQLSNAISSAKITNNLASNL